MRHKPLPFRTIKLFTIPIFLTLILTVQNSFSQSCSVGFIGLQAREKNQGESHDAFAAFEKDRIIRIRSLELKDLRKKSSANDMQVIWIHRPDSSSLSEAETDPKVVEALKEFVMNGGKLLLTLDALRYLPLLGVESLAPETDYVNATDEGYGRKLGMHCFLSHPVFDGLFGGAYLYAPDQDIRARRMGWFGDNVPSGKTVAVDWSYITLTESTKLLAEYDLGKGKILAAGAYTYFNNHNLNHSIVQLFVRNCFEYLSDQSPTLANFWNFSRNEVLTFDNPVDTCIFDPCSDWIPGSDNLLIREKFSGSQPWDLAGEQMLVMGKEKGGIDEIWAHPFMALRDYAVGIRFEGNDSIYWLNDQQPEIEVRPESFTRIYRFRRAYLKEIISCHPTEANIIIHYDLKSIAPARLVVKMKSNLRLMWPYSERVTGKIMVDYIPGLFAFLFKNERGNMSVVAGANKRPILYQYGAFEDFKTNRTNRKSMASSSFLPDFSGIPTDKFQAAALMEFEFMANDKMDMVITASAINTEEALQLYKKDMFKPMAVNLAAFHYYNNLFTRKLVINSSSDAFNEAYRWALVGTDRFFVNTPGIGRSLVAGYATTDYGWDGGHKVNGRPGYAWYFGRDGVWSSYAVLDYGDFEKVKDVLKVYGKYQDISGKIYHELTTSGVAHYDAADATPLYISLAGHYLRHSGDTTFIRGEWEHIRKALDYCYSTDTDGDGMIENTLVGHGWEEGGILFGTHTTFYLASCWKEALHQAGYIAQALGLKKEFQQYASDEGKVNRMINTDFWNPAKKFFYHGKFKDGTFMDETDVMAAVPLLYQQVQDKEKWNPVLRTLASSEFSSDWGMRIIGDNNPAFRPGSYHQGSVWPLFTGWTSLAEYQYGRAGQGYTHLTDNLFTYRNWSKGFIPEVLHGTEYKPFGVCAHQCWSETMAVQPAIEGMLGLVPDALANRLVLTPAFPVEWDSAEVKNIRMGSTRYGLTMKRTEGKLVYRLTSDTPKRGQTSIRLNLNLPLGTKVHRVLVNGMEYEAEIQDSRLGMNLILSEASNRNKVTAEIFFAGGISATAVNPEPKPGYTSAGCRIIDEELSGETYTLTLNGKSGSDATITLTTTSGIGSTPKNCRLISEKGPYRTYQYHFPEADSKYVTVPLQFNLQ